MNGELYADDQTLVSSEKSGRSSQASSISTQTFKIDLFTDEVPISVELAHAVISVLSMRLNKYVHVVVQNLRGCSFMECNYYSALSHSNDKKI